LLEELATILLLALLHKAPLLPATG
jgi:hypothetical protein